MELRRLSLLDSYTIPTHDTKFVFNEVIRFLADGVRVNCQFWWEKSIRLHIKVNGNRRTVGTTPFLPYQQLLVVQNVQ